MPICKLCDTDRDAGVYVGKKIHFVCKQCAKETKYRIDKLDLKCICGSTKIRRVTNSIYECLDCTVQQQKKYFEGG